MNKKKERKAKIKKIENEYSEMILILHVRTFIILIFTLLYRKKRNEYLQNHYLQDRVESLELPSIRIKKSFGIIRLSRYLVCHHIEKVRLVLLLSEGNAFLMKFTLRVTFLKCIRWRKVFIFTLKKKYLISKLS